ncbi:Serine/threonine-protein phosphatase 7 [Hordeum vulgare]|nr:Serine/threonine-protein phosphatase 7 [Hordeum vulgare]
MASLLEVWLAGSGCGHDATTVGQRGSSEAGGAGGKVEAVRRGLMPNASLLDVAGLMCNASLLDVAALSTNVKEAGVAGLISSSTTSFEGAQPNETLVYDPRYEPYFRRMDLLQFVLNFKGTPPWLNATALTTLMDRWRPETHSFHLPLGEMSITLEDIAMITGLPIEGRALTGKVNWRPYTVLRQFPLSNMCLRDQHLWRVRCPMICFYAVEWHLPHRVSNQFGVQQRTPPDYVETSVKLHKTNRQSNKTAINWEEHHMTWVDMWNAQRQHRVENDETPDNDEAAY